MSEDASGDAPDVQRQLALVEELAGFLRRQDRRQQAASAETRRLRLTIEAAVVRLQATVAGQRASRAELQAVIDDLRTVLGPNDDSDS